MLLVQRKPDKHDPGEAYARFEFPGGRLDDTDLSHWDGALREWHEETGATLPDDIEPIGGWRSPDGVYEGFVVRIAHQDDLTLNPQPEEVSAVGWWNPDDLDDPVIRDKVSQALGLVQPLLKTASNFHLNTDKIIDHYAPLVRAAMAEVIPQDTIRHAIRVAYTSVRKATNNPNQSLPPAPVPNPVATAAIGTPAGAALAGTTGASLALAGASGVAATAAAAQISAAMAVLSGATLATGSLVTVLTALYGDACLQGAYEAAQATNGQLGAGMSQVKVPAGYFNNWTPGSGDAGASAAVGASAQIIASVDSTIEGIVNTELNRVASAIAQGIANGWSPKQTAAAIDQIINDEKRAWLIAETEYANAMVAASRATYLANNVQMLQWYSQPDACSACEENQQASPIRIDQSWPNGNPLVHPHCRCAEGPYITVGGV